MDENSKTLQVYNSNVENYINGTPKEVTGDVKKWLDKSLSFLKPESTILEIGSAFGRDANYMEKLGFKVTRTDGAEQFVNYMNSNGQKAKLLNAVSDSLGGPYDLVFANAVILHFTVAQTEKVLDKVHGALTKNGIFSFRTKKGVGSEWALNKVNSPRFFQYWNLKDLINLLGKHGFNVVASGIGSSARNDFKWIEIIARKKPL